VEGPVPPRPVHRAGEELDAQAPEPLGFGIDIVDEEEDLAGRSALGGLTVDQVGGTVIGGATAIPETPVPTPARRAPT
jgi:hypothetical protein